MLFFIERVDNVHIFTDQSPDGYYNNVSVIEEKSGLTIIDTFKKSETMNAFLEIIRTFDKPIKRTVFTHWHIDHTLGAYFLPDTDIYASAHCRDKLIEFRDKYQELKIKQGVIEEGLSVVIPNNIVDKVMELPMDDGETLTMTPYPGHSFDGLIIEYKDMLFVGDNVVGKEVHLLVPPAIPPDAPKSKAEDLLHILNYIESLNPGLIIYGHGKRLEPEVIIKDNRSRLKTELGII